MKKLTFVVLFFVLTFSCHLDLGAQINLYDHYQLNCVGKYRNVNYFAQNLPLGVNLVGNRLQVVDKNQIKEGYYPIKLKAEDSEGEIDERIILLFLKRAVVNVAVKSQSSVLKTEIEGKEQVQSILDELSISETVDGQFQYPENGYPTENFPSGINTEVRNNKPLQIRTKQAIRSDANRNIITAEDIKSRSIFERQLNAAKALANLLAIVKQATANRNVALLEIEQRTKIFQTATAAQRQAEEKIAQAENELARVKEGIDTTNDKINEIRTKIDELTMQRQNKQTQRESFLVGIENAKKSLNDVISELHDTNRELVETQRDLEDKEFQIEGLEEEKDSTETELTNSKDDKTKLENDISDATDKLQSDKETVADLKKRLAEAEAQLVKSENNLKNLKEEDEKLQQLIDGIQKRLDDLNDRITKSNDEAETLRQKIENLKEKIQNELEVKKQNIQDEIENLTQKLTEVTQQLSQLPEAIKSLQDSLNELLEKLRFLRSQVFIYENRLRAAYEQGNAANEKALIAKRNLEEANLRYKKECKIIQQATKNIEIARVEKEKADQAVEDHLRGSAEILQFPGGVVPQENGLMYAGSGKYLIDGWKKYVEEAFGISVNPLFSGHVSELYEFDIDKRDDEDHRPIDHPEKDCKDKHKKLVAISGYILKVKYHSFEVLSHDGEHYKIKYDDCTKALSCAQDYLLTAGDIVVLKGIKKEDGVILADQLTTIRR